MEDEGRKIIPLNEFLEAGFRQSFGMTADEARERGICVQCKKPATFHSEAGRREYMRNSALCEGCFDEMFEED
jgi:hypothetical protein